MRFKISCTFSHIPTLRWYSSRFHHVCVLWGGLRDQPSTPNWVFVFRSAHICISIVPSNKARCASYVVDHHVNMIWLINRISFTSSASLWRRVSSTGLVRVSIRLQQSFRLMLTFFLYSTFFQRKRCSLSSSFSPPFIFLPFFLCRSFLSHLSWFKQALCRCLMAAWLSPQMHVCPYEWLLWVLIPKLIADRGQLYVTRWSSWRRWCASLFSTTWHCFLFLFCDDELKLLIIWKSLTDLLLSSWQAVKPSRCGVICVSCGKVSLCI